MKIDILQGDSLTVLRTLPTESVHCVVTSPPYWGLRDYGTAKWEGGSQDCNHSESSPSRTAASVASSTLGGGKSCVHRSHQFKGDCLRCGAVRVDQQIGLEMCLGEHIDVLVEVFREVRRVLRSDGTCWLNYGDAYASTPNGRSAADTKVAGNDDRTFRDKPISTIGAIYVPNHESRSRVGASGNKGNPGADHRGRVVAGGTLKPKDRMLLPARVAIALQDDGWWVRDEIIWHKPNPMPSSVKDRTTPAHEMIYMLSKSPQYYYDHLSVRQPATSTKKAGLNSGVNVDHVPRSRKTKVPGGWDKGDGAHGTVHRNGRTEAEYVESEADGKRNPRSVWSVCPAPFREAHFATFPPALIEPCIMAGCPWGGTILDPFFGAGTTGLVAQKLGRNCIGIELNPEYVGIARRRLFLSAFPWAAP